MAPYNEKAEMIAAHRAEEEQQLAVAEQHHLSQKLYNMLRLFKAMCIGVCFILAFTITVNICKAQGYYELANKVNALEMLVDHDATTPTALDVVHEQHRRDLAVGGVDSAVPVLSATPSGDCDMEHTLEPGYTTESALPVQGTPEPVLTSYQTVTSQTTITLTSVLSVSETTPASEEYTSTTTVTQPSSTLTVVLSEVAATTVDDDDDCAASAGPTTVFVTVTATTPVPVTPYEETSTTTTSDSSSITYILTTIYTTLTSTIGQSETVITAQVVETQTEIVTIGGSSGLVSSSSTTSSDDFFATSAAEGVTASAPPSSSASTSYTSTTQTVLATVTEVATATATAVASSSNSTAAPSLLPSYAANGNETTLSLLTASQAYTVLGTASNATYAAQGNPSATYVPVVSGGSGGGGKVVAGVLAGFAALVFVSF